MGMRVSEEVSGRIASVMFDGFGDCGAELFQYFDQHHALGRYRQKWI